MWMNGNLYREVCRQLIYTELATFYPSFSKLIRTPSMPIIVAMRSIQSVVGGCRVSGVTLDSIARCGRGDPGGVRGEEAW